jgi:hypothetical protein
MLFFEVTKFFLSGGRFDFNDKLCRITAKREFIEVVYTK